MSECVFVHGRFLFRVSQGGIIERGVGNWNFHHQKTGSGNFFNNAKRNKTENGVGYGAKLNQSHPTLETAGRGKVGAKEILGKMSPVQVWRP